MFLVKNNNQVTSYNINYSFLHFIFILSISYLIYSNDTDENVTVTTLSDYNISSTTEIDYSNKSIDDNIIYKNFHPDLLKGNIVLIFLLYFIHKIILF